MSGVQLKSVSISASKFGLRLLMDTASVAAFQHALKNTIRAEVFVVNTNMGMEVYYISTADFSPFIKEQFLRYRLSEVISEEALEFKNLGTTETVFSRFNSTMVMFADYPQLFLAYSKKFVFLLAENKANKTLVQVLALFYTMTLQQLRLLGKVPHVHKINQISSRSNALLAEDGHFSIKRILANKLLSRVHIN